MKKKVLILEAEGSLKQKIKIRLDNIGCELININEGRQALKSFEDGVPDLIVTDDNFPVEGGDTFYKELKKSIEASSVPVIIFMKDKCLKDCFFGDRWDVPMLKTDHIDTIISKAKMLLNGININMIDLALEKVQSFPELVQKSEMKCVLTAGLANPMLKVLLDEQKREEFMLEQAKDSTGIIIKSILYLPDIIIMNAQTEYISISSTIEELSKIPDLDAQILLFSYFQRIHQAQKSTINQILSTSLEKIAPDMKKTPYYLGAFTEEKVKESFLTSIKVYW